MDNINIAEKEKEIDKYQRILLFYTLFIPDIKPINAKYKYLNEDDHNNLINKLKEYTSIINSRIPYLGNENFESFVENTLLKQKSKNEEKYLWRAEFGWLKKNFDLKQIHNIKNDLPDHGLISLKTIDDSSILTQGYYFTLNHWMTDENEFIINSYWLYRKLSIAIDTKENLKHDIEEDIKSLPLPPGFNPELEDKIQQYEAIDQKIKDYSRQCILYSHIFIEKFITSIIFQKSKEFAFETKSKQMLIMSKYLKEIGKSNRGVKEKIKRCIDLLSDSENKFDIINDHSDWGESREIRNCVEHSNIISNGTRFLDTIEWFEEAKKAVKSCTDLGLFIWQAIYGYDSKPEYLFFLDEELLLKLADTLIKLEKIYYSKLSI